MTSVATADLWDPDQYNDEVVQEYYGDAEGIARRWADSFNKPPLGSVGHPTPNSGRPCDFLSIVSAISETYSHGNYLRMRSLDRETFSGLGPGGSTFQASESRLTFDVVSENQHSTRRKVANRIIIKRVKADAGLPWDTGAMHAFIQEVRILHHMRGHPNIVNLRGIGWFYDMEHDTEEMKLCPKPVVILEQAANTLDYLVRKDGNAPASLTKLEIFHDIARGLQALHDCGIVHGDLKPANILIFEKERREGGVMIEGFVAKVSDFSLAILNNDPGGRNQEQHLAGGTIYWTAPEANSRLSLDRLKKTDVWSLGLLFGVVSSGSDEIIKTRAGEEADAQDVANRIRQHFENSIESSAWETKLVTLVRQLYLWTLQVDPEERNLKALLLAFERFLGHDFNATDVTNQTQLRTTDPADLHINFEAFKTLSGPLKDFMLEKLIQVTKDAEDPRRSKVLFELAIGLISKFASPDASASVGFEYLLEAAKAGDIRAKGLHYRLRQAHHFHPPLQITRQLSEEWLYEAAAQGHQTSIQDLMHVDMAKAKQARAAEAMRYFSSREQTEQFDELENSLTMLLRQQGLDDVHDYSITNQEMMLGFQAAAVGDLGSLKALLDSCRDFPNLQNSDGDTPLLIASRFGQYEAMRMLMDYGADASVSNEHAENVLHYLWRFDQEQADELLQICAQKGADPYAEARGRLHNPILEILPLMPGMPMERAAALGRLDLVKLFMRRFPVVPHNGNVIRRTLLWAFRLHHTDIQDFLIIYASTGKASTKLCLLIDTVWTHNGQQRNFMEAASLGWISADSTGVDAPFDVWMQCCHGSQWRNALEGTLRTLTYMDFEPRAMETRVDQGLKTAFETWNYVVVSLLLNLKVETTSGSLNRTRSLRPLAWKDVQMEANRVSRITKLRKELRHKWKVLGDPKTDDTDGFEEEYLPLPAHEIGFVDQIFHDEWNRTLAQQCIISGDRHMIRLLRTQFGADLSLPVISVADIPPIFQLRSRRGSPEPKNQFNCYSLIACAIPRDVWFANEFMSTGYGKIHLDCPFDEPPVTTKLYLPPLFYAIVHHFWPYAIWLLQNGADIQQPTAFDSTVLEELLSIGIVRLDILKFFFRGITGSGKGSSFVPASMNLFGGYPIFRILYESMTRDDSYWRSEVIADVYEYGTADGGYGSIVNKSQEKINFKGLYLETCTRLPEIWKYLLLTYPNVENAPTFTFKGIEYKALSILDQSLRLFTTQSSWNMWTLKTLWTPWADLSQYHFPEVQPALEGQRLKYAAYQGLTTFQVTVEHFEQESITRQKPFPQQSLQSRLLGSPLDLFPLQSENGRILRAHGWKPSFCHPVIGNCVCFMLELIAFLLLLVNLIVNHWSRGSDDQNVGHSIFSAVVFVQEGLILSGLMYHHYAKAAGATIVGFTHEIQVDIPAVIIPALCVTLAVKYFGVFMLLLIRLGNGEMPDEAPRSFLT